MDNAPAPQCSQGSPAPQAYTGAPLLALTLGGGLTAFFLRLYMNRACREAQGFLRRSCPAYTALWILSLAVLLGLIWFTRGMGSGSRFRRSYSPSVPAGAAQFAAAALLLFYSISCLGGESDIFRRLTAVFGFLCCGCLVFSGMARLEPRRCAFLFPLISCLFLACRMFCEFRQWSTDPETANYCFRLLANAAGMLAAFHAAGFSIDHGQRRRCLFFCLSCVYFSLLSLADYPRDILFHGALIFWMFGILPRLKKPRPRRRPGGQVIAAEDWDDPT